MQLFTIVLVAAITWTSLAAAQDGVPRPILLSCKSSAGEDFTIELFGESPFGPLHCVQGLMIVDMTPCAPNGGWGLSYPTGSAGLAEVTPMWAVAYKHSGGKFTATLGPEKFTAVAAFGEGLEPDLSNGSYDMTIALNRTTGAGSYESGALGKVKFQCEVKTRKF
ncbi:MAG TPA: hypothetical protein PLI43_09225 [Albidovulum sp.]|uniref:hypothetical protein n=1 Tax=Albidovulum sp. TaxID=1872424 RepID=UPI002D082FCC|nr:hypothetical protein [Albidovulum sp.]